MGRQLLKAFNRNTSRPLFFCVSFFTLFMYARLFSFGCSSFSHRYLSRLSHIFDPIRLHSVRFSRFISPILTCSRVFLLRFSRIVSFFSRLSCCCLFTIPVYLYIACTTVKVKSLAPLFCFQLFISTTQDLFNSIIYPNTRDQVLHLYIYVQNEKPMNMKYTEKDKLQYFEKNNRKKRQNHSKNVWKTFSCCNRNLLIQFLRFL
jgi:hypothetical protein